MSINTGTYIFASYKNKVALPAHARMCNTSSHRFVVTFLGRHPELRLRTTTNIKRSRAKVSREEVHKFFEHFQAGV